MIEINDTRRDNLPLSDEQFKDVLEQIASDLDTSNMTPFEIVEHPYIFDVKDTDNFTDGFELIAQMQIDEKDNIGINIRKMIIFENDDEWLTAFKRIQDIKKQSRD
jgi:hypothetical protein